MLSCVQVNHQYGKTRVEDTKEWSICLGDEAHDCEQEGEATSQGSIVYMGRLSIHFRQHGVQGMGMGQHILRRLRATCVRLWHSRCSEVLVKRDFLISSGVL